MVGHQPWNEDAPGVHAAEADLDEEGGGEDEVTVHCGDSGHLSGRSGEL
jgi:hypothetical protein